MVINDFNIDRLAIHEPEADAPLVINSDAVLALPVSKQCFEPVATNRGKVAQRKGRVKKAQPSPSRLLDPREPFHKEAVM